MHCVAFHFVAEYSRSSDRFNLERGIKNESVICEIHGLKCLKGIGGHSLEPATHTLPGLKPKTDSLKMSHKITQPFALSFSTCFCIQVSVSSSCFASSSLISMTRSISLSFIGSNVTVRASISSSCLFFNFS